MNILVNYKEKYDTTTTIQRVLTSVQFNFVGICCLDKYHPDIMESVKDGSRNSPLTFGSVTAELLLILTNVARSNVAWTNVVLTGDIC